MRIRSRLQHGLLLLLPLLGLHGAARAADLAIGLQTDVRAMDPHVAPSFVSSALHQHIFDTLIAVDAELRLVPGLATAWRAVGDTAWEFDLREGVRFSDGSPFTAEDVLITLQRVNSVQHGAGTYAPYARAITAASSPTPLRIRLETAAPYPQLPFDLSRIRIVSARAAEGADTAAFNRGEAAIGTGPYRMLRWTPNDRLELVRNPLYWGAPAAWDQIAIRPIPNDAARLAALLSGDVGLIDKVPLNDVARLRGDARIRLFVHDGNRSMFLVPDVARETSPFVMGADGRPLPDNPLRDARVRRAISLAINRRALAERAMEGFASPADQPVPAGMFGWAGETGVGAYDPATARHLLAEAGYSQGFRMTLHCSNGRYVNDRQTCLAVVQMLSRIGIQAQAEAEPQSVFYTRMARFDASLMLNGWGSYGDSLQVLRQALHSVDAARGYGAFNRGHYANPEVDRLIETAARTIEDGPRERLQQQAMRIAMTDLAVIPLYTASWVWAARRGISYEAGFDEGTFAMRATPGP
ncbi:ABC transporter substrate-binding protein [Roseomonas hellenica]|uniref:ABC transporter substrate-binding protein n=1 Tax=Plastoroseomonas hellenica TaxID=2687306 RepID=A0ABS5F2T8_9PROT|nr:ABC transporter substrate-binding protein [Plastoroseomonas hellenica]MBR0666850.1 ABC transporter substrate-binding protein [Plastoroseomonas hellenica]